MFLDKLLSLVVGLIFLIALSCDGPTGKSGEENKAVATTRTLANDSAFWDYAVSSNILQTELGQLVQSKENAQVRSLASEATRYHGNALEKLKRLAKGHYTGPLPDSLSGADRDMVNEFKLLEGEELATRYRAFISSTHQRQLARYQEALQRTEDPKIREWLNDMLLHLQQQLEHLSRMDSLQEESI